MKLTWLITRSHSVRATCVYFNSPLVIQWRQVGRVKAGTREEAMAKAREATGAAEWELCVVGLGKDLDEKEI